MRIFKRVMAGLAILATLGMTATPVFAAVPAGCVIFGDGNAYDLGYANSSANLAIIQKEVVNSNNQIWVNDFNNNIIDNNTGNIVPVSVLPTILNYYQGIQVKEPVIYLYPTIKQQISVKLNFNGKFTSTYPEYKNGWEVIAHPDGTLLNSGDNKEYPYLIWEGILDNNSWDMTKGFVVAGRDTKDFLQDKLSLMGLTPKECNDFIAYWLPKMQENKYNLITFANEEYKQKVHLSIEPNPDSVLRVLMVYKPITEKIDIPSQQLTTFNRTGFSVVEWGGTEI